MEQHPDTDISAKLGDQTDFKILHTIELPLYSRNLSSSIAFLDVFLIMFTKK